MRIIRVVLIFLLGVISITVFAQLKTVPIDSAKQAELKENIGIDMTVPDFDTKKVDAKVMGNQLAGILNYLMENYQQGIYDRRLCQIVCEQNEVLENMYFQLKKLKFINASKKGNEITILMHIDLQNNAANIKQADIVFHFVDGLSESNKVNELFSYISHYVQAREELL